MTLSRPRARGLRFFPRVFSRHAQQRLRVGWAARGLVYNLNGVEHTDLQPSAFFFFHSFRCNSTRRTGKPLTGLLLWEILSGVVRETRCFDASIRFFQKTTTTRNWLVLCFYVLHKSSKQRQPSIWLIPSSRYKTTFFSPKTWLGQGTQSRYFLVILPTYKITFLKELCHG